MIVKCNNCDTKLKIADEKVTQAGVKIKCPKCASVLLVKKPAEPKPEPPVEEQAAPQGEAVPTEDAPTEEAPEQPAAEDEFSLGDESLDLSGDEEAPAEEPAADETAPEDASEETVPTETSLEDEFSLGDESLDLSGGEEALAEEPPSADQSFEDEFSLDLSGDEEAPEEEPEPEAEEPQESEDVLEGFDDGSFATEITEGEAEEDSAEEFQLDTNFDFSGEPEEASGELKDNLDLAGDVSPGDTEEESGEAAPEPAYGLDEEPTISLRDEPEEAAEEEEAPELTPDIAASDNEDTQAQPQPKANRRPPAAAAHEVTGYGVSTRRSMPIIIPIILIIAVLGASFFAYKKFNEGKTQETGTLTIYDENGKFLENEKEGKVFVVTGKVRNDYNVDRSFIQIKGIIFDADDNELASKVVYAGNIPTDLECRKLTISAIDELLKSKMGDELSNMNVSSGTSISFKIVFANIDEELVSQFKVVGAGSELAFSH